MTKTFWDARSRCVAPSRSRRPPPTEARPSAKKMGTLKMTATVVSTDASGEQITVRNLSTGNRRQHGDRGRRHGHAEGRGQGRDEPAVREGGRCDHGFVHAGTILHQHRPVETSVSGQALADQHCAS